MESVKSFRGSGMFDELEDRAFRRRTRRRVIIIVAASVVLLAAIVSIVWGAVLKKRSDNAKLSSAAPMTPAASIRAVCNATEYPNSCFSSITTLESSSNSTDPRQIFKLSLLVAINGAASFFNYTNQLVPQVG